MLQSDIIWTSVQVLFSDLQALKFTQLAFKEVKVVLYWIATESIRYVVVDETGIVSMMINVNVIKYNPSRLLFCW